MLRARGRNDIGAVFVGDGPELARVRAPPRGSTPSYSPGRCRTTACRRYSPRRHRRRAVRSRTRIAPLSLGFYWSPLKIFEYMAAGCPLSPRRSSHSGAGRTRARRAAIRCAIRRAGRRARGAGRSGAARAHGARGARTRGARLQLVGALPGARCGDHGRCREPARAERRRFGARRAHPDSDRRVSADLRRQRLEHLRAGARAARARP